MSNKHKWADVIHAFAEGKEIQWRFLTINSSEISIWEDIPKIQDPQFNNSCIEWRVKPHKYQDVIDAYVRGETVQYYATYEMVWVDCNRGKKLSMFDSGHEYRIKPKPDIVRTAKVSLDIDTDICCSNINFEDIVHNVRFTFDGETGDLKEIKML